MTLVATWFNPEQPNTPEIWSVADTAITSVDSTLQDVSELNTLTEYGSKILEVPIVCKILPNKDHEVYFRSSIGFAFAGSSLVALNTYATLCTVLNSLGSTVAKKALPDYISISNTVRQITSFYTSSIRDRVEICVYGFCPKTKLPFISTIKSELIDGTWEYAVSQEYQPTEGLNCIYLGNKEGVEKLQDMVLIESRRITQTDRFRYWRTPAKMLDKVVKQGSFPTVGGGLQIGVVGLNYFYNLHTVETIGGEPRAFYRNIDVHEKTGMNIGDCLIAISGLILNM